MKFFGIIVSLLLLVWYVPAMVWGVQITSAMNSFQNGEAGAFEGLLDGPAPLAWWRNRSELKQTFDPVELNHRRTVSFQVEMPFEELLAPGEAMPDEDLRDLYAMARAPARLNPVCAEFLEVLATRCDAASVQGRTTREGTVAKMEATFHYAPAYDMGDPSAVQNGDVFTGRARLTDSEPVEATPEGRAEAISRALSVCDALREVYGNCVISSVSFGAAGQSGTVRVSARFSVFADKSQHGRATVENTVERVSAATLGATQ